MGSPPPPRDEWGVEIIVNDASYRSTPNVIIYGQERHIGDGALSRIKRELNNSVFFPTRYFSSLSQDIKNESRFSFSKISDGKFHVNFEGEQISLTPHECTAALFTKFLQVLALNGVDDKEVVVSVPSFFTQYERQSIIDSAKVAGVEIVRLFNESSASVLDYGIFRKSELSNETGRVVAFVDFGHSKTSVYFAKLFKDKAEILCEVSERHLGVRDIDRMLLSFYSEKFRKLYKQDLHDNPKAMFRLLDGIEKQRKVLTANSEAVLNLDCLFEDNDFSYMMKRDEFENLASTVLIRLEELIKAGLQELGDEKIHSVERLGGGTRIPAVENLILRVFKVNQVSKTLDASESIAKGCGIQSAMLSPLFKVAEYAIKERNFYPFSIKLKYEDDAHHVEKTLFPRFCEYNKTLSISIHRNKKLWIGVYLKADNEEFLWDAHVEPMNPKEEKFEGKIFFHLGKNGTVHFEKAELRESYKEEDKDKTRVTPLHFKIHYAYGLNSSEIEQMALNEKKTKQKEQFEIDRLNAKYKLESFIYKTKNALNESVNTKFFKPEEKAEMLKSLHEQEDWFNSFGENETKDEYLRRLSILTKVCTNYYGRSTKYSDAGNYIYEAKIWLNSFPIKNESLLKSASPLQNNEIEQKMRESLGLLTDVELILNQYTPAKADQLDFLKCKENVDKNCQVMSNVLNTIYKEIEEKERKKREDERLAKEALEKEAKLKEKNNKDKKVETKDSSKGSDKDIKKPDDSKMDVE